MKRVTILVLVQILGVVLLYGADHYGKKIDVPKKVLTTFHIQYTNAMNIKWQMEGNDYEASFVLNGKTYDAEYKPDGKWVMTESDIASSKMPLGAVKYVKQNYQDYKFKEYEFFETPVGNFYILGLKNGKNVLDIYFDLNGKFVKSVSDQ